MASATSRGILRKRVPGKIAQVSPTCKDIRVLAISGAKVSGIARRKAATERQHHPRERLRWDWQGICRAQQVALASPTGARVQNAVVARQGERTPLPRKFDGIGFDARVPRTLSIG